METVNPKPSRGYLYWNYNDIIRLILITFTVTGILREFYFSISPWVLSQNKIYPKGVLTPWMERHNEARDGIEIYVLYILMFMSIGISAILIWFFKRLHQSLSRVVLRLHICLL